MVGAFAAAVLTALPVAASDSGAVETDWKDESQDVVEVIERSGVSVLWFATVCIVPSESKLLGKKEQMLMQVL